MADNTQSDWYKYHSRIKPELRKEMDRVKGETIMKFSRSVSYNELINAALEHFLPDDFAIKGAFGIDELNPE